MISERDSCSRQQLGEDIGMLVSVIFVLAIASYSYSC